MKAEFYVEFLPILDSAKPEAETVTRIHAAKLYTSKPKFVDRTPGTQLVKMEVEVPLTWFDVPIIDLEAEFPPETLTRAVETLRAVEEELGT